MNTSELIKRFRHESGDTEETYQWTDDELLLLFNEAIDEACKRKMLIFDKVTASVCEISLLEGTSTYPIDQAVVFVNQAYIVNAYGRYTYLKIHSRDKIDRLDQRWRESTARPWAVVVEETNLEIIPGVREDATLYLEVYRTPLVDEKLTLSPNPITSPAIALEHHRYLHHWPLSVVYSREDADYYAPDIAATHLGKFTAYFGEPVNARRLRDRQEDRPLLYNRWW